MEENQKKDKYPGYPHYPASEDITRADNNNGVVRPDAGNATDNQDTAARVADSDADVTAEDLRLLEAADQNMDNPDDRNLLASALDDTDMDGDPLNEEGSIANKMSGSDLDVPGSMADDKDEAIGEEDEENNYYSLGGDLHESQEENKGE